MSGFLTQFYERFVGREIERVASRDELIRQIGDGKISMDEALDAATRLGAPDATDASQVAEWYREQVEHYQLRKAKADIVALLPEREQAASAAAKKVRAIEERKAAAVKKAEEVYSREHPPALREQVLANKAVRECEEAALWLKNDAHGYMADELQETRKDIVRLVSDVDRAKGYYQEMEARLKDRKAEGERRPGLALTDEYQADIRSGESIVKEAKLRWDALAEELAAAQATRDSIIARRSTELVIS